jgi:hypothetical protein
MFGGSGRRWHSYACNHGPVMLPFEGGTHMLPRSNFKIFQFQARMWQFFAQTRVADADSSKSYIQNGTLMVPWGTDMLPAYRCKLSFKLCDTGNQECADDVPRRHRSQKVKAVFGKNFLNIYLAAGAVSRHISLKRRLRLDADIPGGSAERALNSQAGRLLSTLRLRPLKQFCHREGIGYC